MDTLVIIVCLKREVFMDWICQCSQRRICSMDLKTTCDVCLVCDV